MNERRATDEVVLITEGVDDHAGGTPSSLHRDSLVLSRGWALTKAFLRSAVVIASAISTIVSVAWIKNYVSLYMYGNEKNYSLVGAFAVLPLCALPSPILSLVWEAAELALMFRRHDRNDGLRSGAHVAVEPILCLAGATVAAYWILVTEGIAQITVDIDYYSDDNDAWEAYEIDSWVSLGYFWGTMIIFTATCQLALFALCCIEIRDKPRNELLRKTKQHRKHVSEVLRLAEQRGQNPEHLLRSLEARAYETNSHRRFKPYSTIELATFHQHPVEMVAETSPLEMEGSRAVVGHTAAAIKPEDIGVSPLSPLSPLENTIGEVFPFISGSAVHV